MLNIHESDNSEILAGLAEEIWSEYFTPLIGSEQTRYMVENFQSPSAISQQIADGFRYFLVSLSAQPIGYMAVKPEKYTEKLFLSKFYLKADYRGCGYARRMSDYLKNLAFSQGLREIYLTVNRHNHTAINAYRALGYVQSGEQVKDIGNGFVMDDYIFSLRLSKP